MLAEHFNQPDGRAVTLAARDQVHRKVRELPNRHALFDRHLRDTRGVEASGQLLLDQRTAPERRFVDDQVFWRDAKRQVLASKLLKGSLTGFDSAPAQRAGGRVSVVLLHRAGEKRQKLGRVCDSRTIASHSWSADISFVIAGARLYRHVSSARKTPQVRNVLTVNELHRASERRRALVSDAATRENGKK
jgi:hypothetical protein